MKGIKYHTVALLIAGVIGIGEGAYLADHYDTGKQITEKSEKRILFGMGALYALIGFGLGGVIIDSIKEKINKNKLENKLEKELKNEN